MSTTLQIGDKKINGVSEVPKWIQNGLDKEAIQYAEKFGKGLSPKVLGTKDALTTSQIRNIYGEVQRMKMKGVTRTELLLLKPRLAYTTERKGTKGSKDFRKVIERALDEVINSDNMNDFEKRFYNFANFFEAILAYHRSFGGR